MSKLKLIAVISLSITAVVASADDLPLNHSSHYLMGFAIQSVTVLGSQDERFGFGGDYGYGRPEPKLRRGSVLSQLVYEAYYDQLSSQKYFDRYKDTFAFGVHGLGRWFWPRDKEGRAMYADLGWGFQYANRATFDLDSTYNSTPILGFGALFPTGNREFMLGLRYLHISNAGIVKPNRGQNELVFTIGVRY